MRPKILVGCPTSDHKQYCLQTYLETVTALTYPQFDLVLVDNSMSGTYQDHLRHHLAHFCKKEINGIRDISSVVFRSPYIEPARQRIAQSREVLRAYALAYGYDYFLSLEQDVLPPPDFIERLLAHQKAVVSGLYFKESVPLFNTQTEKVEQIALPIAYVYTSDKDNLTYLPLERVEHQQLEQVFSPGLGCVLIHRFVLEQLQFHCRDDYPAFDDMYFGEDLEKLQIPVFVDTALICRHLHKGTDWGSIV